MRLERDGTLLLLSGVEIDLRADCDANVTVRGLQADHAAAELLRVVNRHALLVAAIRQAIAVYEELLDPDSGDFRVPTLLRQAQDALAGEPAS